MDWKDALQSFKDNNPGLPEGSEPAAEPIAAAAPDLLKIETDRKGRKGKTATIVSGFTCPDSQLQTIASQLKTALATGGSARGGEILLQGDYAAKVKPLLLKMGFKTT